MPCYTTAPEVKDVLRERLIAGPDWIVVALCAEWCHVCRDFRAAFGRFAEARPDATCVWIDIEDDEELVAGIDVEDFPTLAVYRAGDLVHLGAVRAQEAAVAKLLAALGSRPRLPGEAAALPRRLRDR